MRISQYSLQLSITQSLICTVSNWLWLLQDLWKQISTEEKENLTKETYEKNIFRVPVYFRDSNCWESQKKDLILLKADTMSECAMKCYVVINETYL